jgi:hypothetical protein
VKNFPIKILTLSVFLLTGCPQPDTVINSPSPAARSPGPSATAVPSALLPLTATPLPIGVPAVTPKPPVPTTIKPPKKTNYIKFDDRTIDWGTLSAAEKARFSTQDFDNRRLVYAEKPSELAASGEFEFTWDAPPDEISVDESATININTKNLITPENKTISSKIDISYKGAGFFEAYPADIVSQSVGWVGNTLIYGTAKIRLKPVGIDNPTVWKDDAKISIYVAVAHGPTVYYNYKIIR